MRKDKDGAQREMTDPLMIIGAREVPQSKYGGAHRRSLRPINILSGDINAAAPHCQLTFSIRAYS
ncbi:hypothetical protein GCM10011487_42410 [Steroidobacter agaridevorans]|uniref:Uncharacterized protein n=1 Tax=Steroidobacter agaridevorans TaxID=2695856 RepID=A0A829YHE3_9GAMM|nr:hypothetical protein GCM10011487_42410 [Steroidobacter agaridevorans]GFE85371.1 hypothetical protein GCM10011488_03250 [Steroidobacter agaridevorans]